MIDRTIIRIEVGDLEFSLKGDVIVQKGFLEYVMLLCLSYSAVNSWVAVLIIIKKNVHTTFLKLIYKTVLVSGLQ